MDATRRTLLKGLAAGGIVLGTGGYAFAVEPRFRLSVTEYAPDLPGWPGDLPLTIALVTDIHAGEPHMSLERIAEIVAATNALGADMILLGGDYVCSQRFPLKLYRPPEWAELLGKLRAPLGVHAVLGNHDWWQPPAPGIRPDGAQSVRRALQAVGISVMENDVARFHHKGRPFWLAGLGDQLAITDGRTIVGGVDDMGLVLRRIDDSAPAILLAHEPDIMAADWHDRFALILSGHTHGGQVRLFGVPLTVPSHREYAYGLVAEGHRRLIVSAGLGTSVLPVRFGVPPEIVRIRLGGAPA